MIKKLVAAAALSVFSLTVYAVDIETEIITMCRSGSERGKPSADFLRENGFPNARYVVNGFQGSSVKEGEHTGMRTQNGWQNSNLPWEVS